VLITISGSEFSDFIVRCELTLCNVNFPYIHILEGFDLDSTFTQVILLEKTDEKKKVFHILFPNCHLYACSFPKAETFYYHMRIILNAISYNYTYIPL